MNTKCLPRKAFLYKDRYTEDPTMEVTVHCIAQCGSPDEGCYIAASVEMQNGKVTEVEHDRLKFIKKDESEGRLLTELKVIFQRCSNTAYTGKDVGIDLENAFMDFFDDIGFDSVREWVERIHRRIES